jgi:hypothetical protein
MRGRRGHDRNVVGFTSTCLYAKSSFRQLYHTTAESYFLHIYRDSCRIKFSLGSPVHNIRFLNKKKPVIRYWKRIWGWQIWIILPLIYSICYNIHFYMQLVLLCTRIRLKDVLSPLYFNNMLWQTFSVVFSRYSGFHYQ